MSQEKTDEPFFYVGNTYPVPSNMYEGITGFKHVKHEDTAMLGDDTEVIRLEIPMENIKDLLHVIINDILHDSEGARSAKGTRLSDHFNPSKKSETENGLNQLIETFIYGMNAFYANKDVEALRIRENECIPPPGKLKRSRKEAEEAEEDIDIEEFSGGAPTTRSMAALQEAPTVPEGRSLAPEGRITRSMATSQGLTVAPQAPTVPEGRSLAPEGRMTRSMRSTVIPTAVPEFVFKAMPSKEQVKSVPVSRRGRPPAKGPSAKGPSAKGFAKRTVEPAKPPIEEPPTKTRRITRPQTAPAQVQAPLKSMEQSIVCDLIKTHYKGMTQMNIKGVDESRELKHATNIIKQVAYKTKDHKHAVKALHTNYTTDDVLKSRRPYLVSYDAGSDLLNSILGQYDYVDISIVNVKDPGDSMRNRNKLLTSIEKIIHQYPSVEWKNLVLQLKSSAAGLPATTRAALSTFLDACQSTQVRAEVDINVFYFHNYVATRVSECIKHKCFTKHQLPNIVLSNPTPERILADYKSYIHHKFNNILGKERFVVHKKNIRLIVSSHINGAEFKIIDVLYYFDKAHHNRMRVCFNGSPDTGLTKAQYDRPELNSARDVGLHIKEMNDNLGGILETLHEHLLNPANSIRTIPGSATAAVKKIAMTIYLECMFKYIGDFGQVLYCFYLGSIFASFDSSAVSVALTVMNILIRNPKIYKAFKEGSVVKKNGTTQHPGSGYEERMERGLILVTSTKYHGKGVPQVSYFTDYYASRNIKTGSKDLTPEQRHESLVQYFDEIQVERFDSSIKLPEETAIAATTSAPGATEKQLELFNQTVAITNVRVFAREEKNRILRMVEEDNRDEIKMILIPQLTDYLTQSSPDIQLYKVVKHEKNKGGIYIAASGLDLWDVIEKKVAQFLSQMGTITTSRSEHIFKLFIHQLKEYRSPAGKSKTNKERIELLEKQRPHGVRWIYIPDDKRYLTVEYLTYYKRYVKRVFLSVVKEPTEEKRERFVKITDAWERDISQLASSKAKTELLETASSIRKATHRLGNAATRTQGLSDLNILFNINQPEANGKRTKK
jgi:hypothetical protein